MRNDFYVGIYEDTYLSHSFKGTHWKKGHKYIKRIGNVYYYAKKANEFRKAAKKDWHEEGRTRDDFGLLARNKINGIYSPSEYNNRVNHYISTRNSATKNDRLAKTYSDMARKEAQKLFGKKGGEVFSKIAEVLARPTKKKYKTINSGYINAKYVESKVPRKSKVKKHGKRINIRRKNFKYMIPDS